jgi:DNA-binding NarL/FixJ family response regulator
MITVLLVDDQATVRRALRARFALEPDLAVLDEAGDGVEALKLAAALAPDVVLMDVEMLGMDGIRATEALRSSTPGSAVVILSLDDSAATRTRAVIAGAAAFVGKHEAPEALIDTIRRVAGERRARARSPQRRTLTGDDR